MTIHEYKGQNKNRRTRMGYGTGKASSCVQHAAMFRTPQYDILCCAVLCSIAFCSPILYYFVAFYLFMMMTQARRA
jgi:hypothetical protein